MSIDDKKKALIDAGVKVRSNANDERIEELYDAQFGKGEDLNEPEGEEGFTGEETSEVSSFENPPAVVEQIEIPEGIDLSPSGITVAPKRAKGNDAFNTFLLANQDPQMGDKTPAVIEWARENLSAEEFKARYEGRVLPV